MAGGNDGLNTVVPYSNDYYHKARRRIGWIAKEVLKINDNVGLHPKLTGFKELYDAGSLGVVQGIGYPNPNRSHFRSTEIWQTASDSDKNEDYGWIGRYFDNACTGADPTVGVNIGRQMPQAFSRAHPTGRQPGQPEELSVRQQRTREEGRDGFRGNDLPRNERPRTRRRRTAAASALSHGPTKHAGSPLDFIERTALDAQISSDKILAISRKVENHAKYPRSELANSLKLVAQLIGGGLPTRIFYVSQGGYDTHTNQLNSHERLLTRSRRFGQSVRR